MTPGGRRVARYVVGAALLVAGFWAGWRYQQEYVAGWLLASDALLVTGLFLVIWDLAGWLQRRDRRPKAEKEAQRAFRSPERGGPAG